jgi:ribosomal protein S18
MISSQGTTTQTAMWSRWSTCPLQNLLACLLTTVYSVRMARTAYELTCVVESFCGSSCGGVVMGISLQNAALLSHFVSESGRILPKRQTKCCASATVRVLCCISVRVFRPMDVRALSQAGARDSSCPCP